MNVLYARRRINCFPLPCGLPPKLDLHLQEALFSFSFRYALQGVTETPRQTRFVGRASAFAPFPQPVPNYMQFLCHKHCFVYLLDITYINLL